MEVFFKIKVVEVPSFIMIFVECGCVWESERSCFGVAKIPKHGKVQQKLPRKIFVHSVRVVCERVKSLLKAIGPVVGLSGKPIPHIIILDGNEKNEDFLVVCF